MDLRTFPHESETSPELLLHTAELWQTDRPSDKQTDTHRDRHTDPWLPPNASVYPVFLTCLSPLDQDLFKVGTDRKRYRDRYNPGTSLYFPLSYFRWLCISIVVFVFVYLYSSCYWGPLISPPCINVGKTWSTLVDNCYHQYLPGICHHWWIVFEYFLHFFCHILGRYLQIGRQGSPNQSRGAPSGKT